MLNFAKKYNKHERKFTYEVSKDMPYISLAELYNMTENKNTVYTVRAIFINTKSKYGDAPIFAIDNYLVNMPQHLLKIANEMLNDDELITAINKGWFGFSVYTYAKDNKLYCSVNWHDIEPTDTSELDDEIAF